MKAWIAIKTGIFIGLTAVMLFHWSVVEAQAEPIPAIITTDSTAAPADDIFFAERIPSGHWESAGRYRMTHFCPCRKCNGEKRRANSQRGTNGSGADGGHREGIPIRHPAPD